MGVPTLRDVVAELMKPGRDVRDELPAPILRTDVLDIKDLKPGMVLTGTVRNVIDFGVFVDIGVHQDGLVHISQVCSKFIKPPLGDRVRGRRREGGGAGGGREEKAHQPVHEAGAQGCVRTHKNSLSIRRPDGERISYVPLYFFRVASPPRMWRWALFSSSTAFTCV